jgi:hypothetical protein
VLRSRKRAALLRDAELWFVGLLLYITDARRKGHFKINLAI